MTTEPGIIIITDAKDPRLDEIIPMFEDLHEVMNRHGMLLRLAPNGAHIWMDAFRRGLERYNRLVVAQDEGRVVGFTCGSIKLAPEYLGGELTGHWTHLYVDHAYRLSGVSRRMSVALHEWFTLKGVKSLETQVVVDHPSSMPFAGSFGYQLEWYNFRKLDR